MSTRVVLAALALAQLLVLRAAWRGHRDLVRWLGRDPHAARRVARAAALGLAAALVAWALVRTAAEPPRLGGAGADLVIALDVSQSMSADDTAPSRLRRAVRLGERVVRDAGPVRLGLVLFAGDAWVALPLTQDRDALLAYLGAVDTELVSAAGTDLARAIDAALSTFDPASSRPRHVLLFTDGEHGGGGLEDALARARAAGVRIAAVGFGTPDGIELRGPGGEALRDRDEAIVVSRRADGVLRRVAAATEGSYLREREDAPSAARLLPAPSPGGAENEPPAAQGPTVAIVLALALVGLDLALSAGARRARPGRLARAAAPALAGLAALALGAWSPEHEGDRLLDAGEPREALSVYRKIERTSGASARTGIRIGNALFRLGQHEPALAAYLDVLRRFGVDDPDARFVAAYNMGTVLLAQERWPEARDALWSALLERATSVEAKFNYEWALARIEPEPDVPLPPMPPPPEPSPLDESPEGPAPDPSASDAREQEAPQSLSQEEAERWLESLVEAPGEPLRRQIARGSRASSPRSEPGQTW